MNPNKELPGDISVGDFAMDILKSMASDPNALKPALKESTIADSGPNISNIQVSQDFVSLVLEGKKPLQKPKGNEVARVRESKEVKLQSLVERLSSLLVEAKGLLEELSPGCSTTGNIGVNMASKRKPKKKNIYVDNLKKKYGLK
jgi:hypothetical protein